jgi:hypothetical protein
VTDKDAKVLGQVTNIGMRDVGGAIDRSKLLLHKKNPEGGKTRNTFVTGVATGPAGRRPQTAESLAVKAGRLFIPGQSDDIWTGSTEKGEPTRSGVIARRGAITTGKEPDRPTAWIVR